MFEKRSLYVYSFANLLNNRTNIITQRLMSLHAIDDLSSSILDFQANEVRVILRKKHEPVESIEKLTHFNALRFIWQTSGLEEEEDPEIENERLKWRKLGFESENIAQEFENVGVLGLDCFVSSNLRIFILNCYLYMLLQHNFVKTDTEFFAKVI